MQKENIKENKIKGAIWEAHYGLSKARKETKYLIFIKIFLGLSSTFSTDFDRTSN